MGKVRVVYRNDGGVSVIYPVKEGNFDKAIQGELKGLPYKDIDGSELPQSRENREAWERDDAKGVKVNPIKAIQIKEVRERKELIAKEKERILEKQAIDNLKAEGKINE